ncbi:MAG: hypothetical protein IJN67_01415 [Oscillospiraceae bacterium]|nr:hypothetical protein [Oscillospiraceae bacterium]
MRIGKIILRILQIGLLVFLLLAGITGLPSITGMVFIMLTFFVAPKKLVDYWLDDWFCKLVAAVGLLYFWCFVPEQDISTAARNTAQALLSLWNGINTIMGK